MNCKVIRCQAVHFSVAAYNRLPSTLLNFPCCLKFCYPTIFFISLIHASSFAKYSTGFTTGRGMDEAREKDGWVTEL
jgi:hypothetical protein